MRLAPAPGSEAPVTLAVQHVGIQIDAARPADRAGLRIDPRLSEHRWIVPRGKDAAPAQPGKIDRSLGVIIEAQPEPEIVKGSAFNDLWLHEEA